jgi:hypothetical protein
LKIPLQQAARAVLFAIEIATLTALILTTRCANYREVFVGGNIYFTDADCYARMTRVRMCEKHPGLIVRHHDFENFPAGTIPHTTAPLDYLILGLSILLWPLTAHAVDLAGALISPVFALLAGWFLWWWSRRMRDRWALLVLYAISPILVHGTELGRPDHQSLLMLLTTIAICAEWTLRKEASRKWSVISGMAWGFAIWVSVYEPLVLLLLVLACHAVVERRRVGALLDRQMFNAPHRRVGWIFFGMIIALAFLVERRLPDTSIFQSGEIFRNWSRTIGELVSVSPLNPIWFRWAGWLLMAAPFLIWFGFRKRTGPPIFVLVLMVATYLLTIWQARWAYFFLSIFALALPGLLESIKSRAVVWSAIALSIFPVLRDWDAQLWPNEIEYARRLEQRNGAMQLHEMAISLKSSDRHPFMAPWWLSPAIGYWSGQAGVAGSSHESLAGIADSAAFFQTSDWQKAREILENHEIYWVVAYDSDRLATNSTAILGTPGSAESVGRVLDRTPTQASAFFVLNAQFGSFKLFRVKL